MYYYTKRNFNESLVFYCVYTTGVAFDRLKLQRIAITTALFFFFSPRFTSSIHSESRKANAVVKNAKPVEDVVRRKGAAGFVRLVGEAPTYASSSQAQPSRA